LNVLGHKMLSLFQANLIPLQVSKGASIITFLDCLPLLSPVLEIWKCGAKIGPKLVHGHRSEAIKPEIEPSVPRG
jgi:hypothetical protein